MAWRRCAALKAASLRTRGGAWCVVLSHVQNHVILTMLWSSNSSFCTTRTAFCSPAWSRSVTMPQPLDDSSSCESARMTDLLSLRPVLACGVGGLPLSPLPPVMGSPVVCSGGTAMAAGV